jgi:hypothetical protein
VQQHVDVGGLRQRLPVGDAEIQRRGAVAPYLGVNAIGSKGQEIESQRGQNRKLVIIGAELEHVLGPHVMRLQVGGGEWPTAVRDPVASLEIEGLQRRAHAPPMVARAAEDPDPDGFEVEIGMADVSPGVEVLRPFLEVQAAAL